MRVANLNLTKGGGVKLVVHNAVRRWNVQAEAYQVCRASIDVISG